MKKLSTFFFAIATTLAFAQTNISFEESEGYKAGDITGQNGWVATPIQGGGNIAGQVVTAERAKTGAMSFKTAYMSQYGPQQDVIIGGFYTLPTIQPLDNSSFSTDIWITTAKTSNFMIGLVDLTNESFALRLDFDYKGNIFIVDTDAEGTLDLIDTKVAWTPQTWMNLRFDTKDGKTNYYLNGELLYVGEPIEGAVNIEQVRVLHDNYGGNAYIDNMKIGGLAALGLADATKSDVAVYPNPVKDVLNVKLPAGEKLKSVELYNAAGSKVKSSLTDTALNLGGVAPGVYILKVKTDGKDFSKKIIKQ